MLRTTKIACLVGVVIAARLEAAQAAATTAAATATAVERYQNPVSVILVRVVRANALLWYLQNTKCKSRAYKIGLTLTTLTKPLCTRRSGWGHLNHPGTPPATRPPSAIRQATPINTTLHQSPLAKRLAQPSRSLPAKSASATEGSYVQRTRQDAVLLDSDCRQQKNWWRTWPSAGIEGR
jgi:hypothetical protein